MQQYVRRLDVHGHVRLRLSFVLWLLRRSRLHLLQELTAGLNAACSQVLALP